MKVLWLLCEKCLNKKSGFEDDKERTDFSIIRFKPCQTCQVLNIAKLNTESIKLNEMFLKRILTLYG